MALQPRRLGPASVAGLGCSVLFVGCCAWSVMANVFLTTMSAMSPPRPTWSPPPAAVARPVQPVPVAAPPPAAPGPFADTLGRGEREISRSDLGDQWPLTVRRGILRCRRDGAAQVVTFEAPDGRVYAVNGSAALYGADIAPIWAPSREPFLRGTGARVPITSLINIGLGLCP